MATIQKLFNCTEFRAFHPYCRAQYIDAARLDHLRLLGFYVPGAGDGDGLEMGLSSEWHSVFPVPSLFWESWGFLSSSQDHALDQRVRDVGRMAEDGRPHVLRH